EADLSRQCGIGAQKKLLSRLPATVEGPRYLSAAEGAVLQLPAVLARKRHSLGDALIDDVHRHLCQTIDIGLAGAKIAALDGVIKESIDTVAVVLVVLGGVDPALCGDGVSAARGILKTERLNVIAQFGQGSGGAAAGESGADDQDLVFALVGRID